MWLSVLNTSFTNFVIDNMFYRVHTLFKLNHKIVNVNSKLCAMQKVDIPNCLDFNEKETFAHAFLYCKNVANLWLEIEL